MAGKKERQRRLAREHIQRQQERRGQRMRRRRQGGIIAASCCAVALAAWGGYAAFGQGSKPTAAALPTPTATEAAATPTPTPARTAATPTPAPTVSTVAEPASHCTYTPAGTAARKVGIPPATPTTKTTYQATIATNRGTIVLDLYGAKATCTVNSFVYLAGKRYFNNTSCHRLTTAGGLYVLQCGDPTGTGTGGPGYEFANENTAGARYTSGTVAMAHTSAPDSNGSQFFLVYRNSTLAPNYTPFGTVVKGLGIIQNVAKAGTDNANGPGDGHPRDKVVIESVTITKA